MLLCSCSSAGPCGVAASQRVKSRDVLFYLFSQSIFTGNDHEMPGKGRAFYSKDRDFAACAAFTFSENPPDSPLSLVRMACGCSISNKRASDSPA